MNSSRLSRKNRTDIIYKGCGGLTDAFDDVIKSGLRINDEEYDWIAENATDEELGNIILEAHSYEQKRTFLITLEKLLEKFYQNNLVN